MKAAKLVLTGIAIAICVMFVLGTVHHNSKCRNRVSTVHTNDTDEVPSLRTGMMSDPLSMAVKLSN